MSYTVTLSTLIARVRQRSNLEGAAAFVTDPEIIDHINQGICEWHDLVRLTTWGGQFYRSQAVVVTTAGQSSYSLPATFASMLSVDCALTGGNLVGNVYPYPEEDRNRFRSFPGAGSLLPGQPMYYQIQAGNIAFIPVPLGGYTVTLNFVPTAQILVSGTDVLDTFNGWEEFIVLDAAIKCLVKDGQTDIIPLLAGMKASQTARIQKAANSRDMGAAECVHDVVGHHSPWEDF